MSFMEARSAISICNKALSRIAQAPLSGSLDDPANLNKHSARECKTWYPAVVRRLLEKHHWGIATVRQPLALAPVNDFLSEWAFAYLKPSDMAFPVNVAWGYAATGIAYYHGVGYLIAQLQGRPLFRYQNGIIYANSPGADLEYVSFNITEADFTQTFEDLVVLYLAAQLARSVGKDEQLGQSLQQEATNQLNLAIAQELNMGKPRYGDGLSESELARHGGWIHPISGIINL